MDPELKSQPETVAKSDRATNLQVQNLNSPDAYTPIPYNPSLQNVPSTFNALPTSGNLQMCDGGLLFKNVVQSHVQGMAIYSNQIGNFILLSHNDNTKDVGKLIGIDLSTGTTNTYTSEKNYNHPSGIQITGDFLVWPVADSKSQSSYLAFYDLSNFSPGGNDPVLIPNININRSKDSAAAGITYSNGAYVVAVYGSGTLDVYVSNQVQSLNDPLLTWSGPYSTSNFSDGWDCINLLTDTNGTIYLCGFRGMVGISTITDYCDLYQLTISGTIASLNFVETKHLYVEYGLIKYLGGIHCRWGSGISISGSGNMGVLQLYCSARNFLLDGTDLVFQWNNFGDAYAPLTHWTNLTSLTQGIPLNTGMGTATVNNQPNVFGLDNNGNLITYYYSNGSSGWQCANLTQITGGTTLVTSMGIADINGVNVFGLDSSGNLITYYYLNGASGWQCANLTQMTGGTPLVTSMGILNIDDINVFGLDSNGDLITYYYLNGASGWQCANLTQMTGGTPLVTFMGIANVNGVNVFGLDSSGNLITYYYLNGASGWQCANLTQTLTDGTTLTKPMWITGSGQNTYVLGLDDNNNLITCWYNGENWNWTDLSAQQYGSTLSNFLAFIDVYGINIMGLDSSGNVLTCY